MAIGIEHDLQGNVSEIELNTAFQSPQPTARTTFLKLSCSCL